MCFDVCVCVAFDMHRFLFQTKANFYQITFMLALPFDFFSVPSFDSHQMNFAGEFH